MGLKAVLENLDGIDEAIAGFYKEVDGKFVIDIEGVDDHPRVRGVVTANNANKAKRDEYKTKIADLEARLAAFPDDFDPDEYVTLKANAVDPNDPNKRKALDENIQSQKAIYETNVANLKKKHEEELAAKNAELAERDGYIDRTLVDTTLRDALDASGVDPKFRDVTLAYLKSSVKVIRDDRGGRSAIVETDLGEIPAAEFVKEWATSKGKDFLAKPSGPNANGNNGRINGSKTITRADFDKLDPAAKAKAVTVDKLTVVD